MKISYFTRFIKIHPTLTYVTAVAIIGLIGGAIFLMQFLQISLHNSKAATLDPNSPSALTQQLLDAASKNSLTTTIAGIAIQRKTALLQAVKDGNASEVFKSLLTKEQIATLPTDLTTQGLVEKPTTANGTITIMHADYGAKVPSKLTNTRY